MKGRFIAAFLLPAVVLTLPFLLRRTDNALSDYLEDADTLVIISAHSEPMKFEWEHKFRKYYKEKYKTFNLFHIKTLLKKCGYGFRTEKSYRNR